MNYQYNSYEDIPQNIVDYMVTVTGEQDLKSVPLEDISSFLEGLDEFHSRMDEIENLELMSP
jgi:hypothetical protein